MPAPALTFPPFTPSSAGVQPGRVAVPAIAAGATADVVASFPPRSGDAALDYAVSAVVEAATDDLRVDRVVSRDASSVTVRVRNAGAAASAADGNELHVVIAPYARGW